MQKRIIAALSVLFIATAALPAASLAATLTAPEIQFSVMTDSMQDKWTDTSTLNSTSGAFDADGMRMMDGVWAFTWDMSVDPDPFITSTLTFTNLASTTQTFSAIATLPVGSGFSPAFMGGSISGSVTDTGIQDGSATVANTSLGSPIFLGLIDGSNALSLLAGSFNCGGSLPGCTQNIATVSSGLPGPSLPYAPGVASSIGIQLDFTLTAGDTASFNSYFEVVPIPIPAAAWLLLSGLITLGGAFGRGRIKQ